MRRKENYNIYMTYSRNGEIFKSSKLATVKSRGLAEVSKDFYIKFYANLISSEKINNVDVNIILK